MTAHGDAEETGETVNREDVGVLHEENVALVGLFPPLGQSVAVEKSVDITVAVGLPQQVTVGGQRDCSAGVENRGDFDLEHQRDLAGIQSVVVIRLQLALDPRNEGVETNIRIVCRMTGHDGNRDDTVEFLLNCVKVRAVETEE